MRIDKNPKVLMLFLESGSTMFMQTKIPKRWAYFAEIASFLKKENYEVKVMDCLNPHISHGEIFQEIASVNYDYIILIARRETVRSISENAYLIKEISPKAKILVYGDMANYVPNFFKKINGLDAVLESGDWEVGISDYILYDQGEISIDQLKGVSVFIDGQWSIAGKGKLSPIDMWTFSDISTLGFINKDLYLSITDGEITISTSKGCPFRCGICPAIITFGGYDRRQSIESIVEYIKQNKNQVKSFKLFSPTFTYNEDWVKNFCEKLLVDNLKINWSCTSRPDCLQDQEMIQLMGKSGCTKIAIGVETLDPESNKSLRKFFKVKDYIQMVEQVFRDLLSCNIEPKPLLMLGIEGQTRDNLISSFTLLEKFGANQLRCAAYSPRHELRMLDESGNLTIEDIEKYDKMTYQNISIPNISREEFLKLIYSKQHFLKILS